MNDVLSKLISGFSLPPKMSKMSDEQFNRKSRYQELLDKQSVDGLSPEEQQEFIKIAPANTTGGLGEANPQPTEKGRAARPKAAVKYFNDESSMDIPATQEQERGVAGKIVGKAVASAPPELQVSKLDAVVPTEVPQEKVDVLAPFLGGYQDAINRRDAMLRDADVREATAGMAAALAGGKSQYSAKNLRDRAELQTQDFTKGLEARNLEELNNSQSDISKFAQERARAILKNINPESPLVGKLNNMTAQQLKSVFGDKVLGGGSSTPNRFVTIEDEDGNIRSRLVSGDTGDTIRELGLAGYAPTIQKDELTKQLIRASKSNASAGVTKLNKESEALKKATNFTETGEVPKYVSTDLGDVNFNLYKKFEDQQAKFQKETQDIREAVRSAMILEAKLKPGPLDKVSYGLLGGIQTQAAKMAGQKGVLTDQDLVKFAGEGGVLAQIERIRDGSFFGKMSDSDVKFFKRFAQLMKEKTPELIDYTSQTYVDAIAQDAPKYLPGITRDNVKEWFSPQSMTPKSSNTDTVKVISPDGKTGSIPRKNLEKALEKGYKEVK